MVVPRPIYQPFVPHSQIERADLLAIRFTIIYSSESIYQLSVPVRQDFCADLSTYRSQRVKPSTNLYPDLKHTCKFVDFTVLSRRGPLVMMGALCYVYFFCLPFLLVSTSFRHPVHHRLRHGRARKARSKVSRRTSVRFFKRTVVTFCDVFVSSSMLFCIYGRARIICSFNVIVWQHRQRPSI